MREPQESLPSSTFSGPQERGLLKCEEAYSQQIVYNFMCNLASFVKQKLTLLTRHWEITNLLFNC